MRIRFACLIGVAALSALGCGTASEEGSDDSVEGGEQGGAGGRGSQAGTGGRAESVAGSESGAGTAAFPGAGGTGTSGGNAPASTGGMPGSGASDIGGAAGGEDFGQAGDQGAAATDGSGGSYVDQPGQCIAPCELALGPSDNLPGKSAVVLYDFQSNTATLTSDAQTNATSQWVIGFSYESEADRGYGAWITGPWWFAFTDPLEYVEGTHSMKQDLEITSQVVNPSTNQILRVVYSFGVESVRIHAIGVPDCDAAASGACASPLDCVAVESGTLRTRAETCSASCNGGVECTATCVSEGAALSPACSTCYAEFLACATSGCPGVCPGTGDACMDCETEHDCHLGFMACSGLDYMPRGTLTWPPPPLAR
jgi:hypothetical protein